MPSMKIRPKRCPAPSARSPHARSSAVRRRRAALDRQVADVGDDVGDHAEADARQGHDDDGVGGDAVGRDLPRRAAAGQGQPGEGRGEFPRQRLGIQRGREEDEQLPVERRVDLAKQCRDRGPRRVGRRPRGQHARGVHPGLGP
jgi:hypothetical protein